MPQLQIDTPGPKAFVLKPACVHHTVGAQYNLIRLGKSSGVASRSGVHSVAPYSFRSATDESVQAIGLTL